MTVGRGTEPSRPSDHSGRESATGYLYQAKLALLELLAGSAGRPEAAISLELYDDVAWEEGGSPIELLQLKHHVASSRTLTDMSEDVWRTISVWLDSGPPADPDGPLLSLVTTLAATEGTAMAALRPHDYNLSDAIRLLEAAAQRSASASTRVTRQRFLALSAPERTQFLGRIRVLDASPEAGDIDHLVRTELRFATPPGREQPFLDRLWGWWFTRVLEMLRGDVVSVSAFRLRFFIDDLHSEFVRENLPTFDDLHLDDQAIPEYDSRPFIHQLRWVDAPDAILRQAVLDYYKAFAHTARWLQEDLIGIDELTKYEARLVEEWDVAFAWLLKDLPAGASDKQKQEAGQKLLRTTLDRTAIRIRERFSDPFFTRGKHHGLADEGQIGWHPEFRQRLADLLLARIA